MLSLNDPELNWNYKTNLKHLPGEMGRPLWVSQKSSKVVYNNVITVDFKIKALVFFNPLKCFNDSSIPK